jgi:hypothetical protein
MTANGQGRRERCVTFLSRCTSLVMFRVVILYEATNVSTEYIASIFRINTSIKKSTINVFIAIRTSSLRWMSVVCFHFVDVNYGRVCISTRTFLKLINNNNLLLEDVATLCISWTNMWVWETKPAMKNAGDGRRHLEWHIKIKSVFITKRFDFKVNQFILWRPLEQSTFLGASNIIIRGATALANLGPAEQPPLAVFPDCTRRLTCGQHIESHTHIFNFPNRTVTSLFK